MCLAGIMEKECGTSQIDINLFLRKAKWPAWTMKCFKHYKMYWVPETRQFCIKCPLDLFPHDDKQWEKNVLKIHKKYSEKHIKLEK